MRTHLLKPTFQKSMQKKKTMTTNLQATVGWATSCRLKPNEPFWPRTPTRRVMTGSTSTIQEIRLTNGGGNKTRKNDETKYPFLFVSKHYALSVLKSIRQCWKDRRKISEKYQWIRDEHCKVWNSMTKRKPIVSITKYHLTMKNIQWRSI